LTITALPDELYEVQEFVHKRDMAILAAENAVLRTQLLEAGLEPVTHTGAEWLEMFRQAAMVMRTAQLALNELGTSKEMLERWT
jgi:hypothetical protein